MKIKFYFFSILLILLFRTIILNAAQIVADVKPENSEVLINGIKQGETPFISDNLSSGNYTVRIIKDGYEPLEMNINLAENETKEIDKQYLNKKSATVQTKPEIASFNNNNNWPQPPPEIKKDEPDFFKIILTILILLIVILIILFIAILRKKTQGTQYDNNNNTGNIGNYKVLDKFPGGMGTVYKCCLPNDSKKLFAIKKINENHIGDSKFLERFIREMNIGMQLQHPNIVRIIEKKEEKGIPYIIMEFVEGINLRQYIDKFHPLPVSFAVKTIINLCEAIDFAHSKDIIHRDIKPENIIVDKNGQVKLFDFGIALARSMSRITDDAGRFFSRYNMFPDEQAENVSDIYSLGTVFYELITKHRFFENETNITAILSKHKTAARPRMKEFVPNIDDRIENVYLKMVEINPADRYSTKKVIEELKKIKL